MGGKNVVGMHAREERTGRHMFVDLWDGWESLCTQPFLAIRDTEVGLVVSHLGCWREGVSRHGSKCATVFSLQRISVFFFCCALVSADWPQR